MSLIRGLADRGLRVRAIIEEASSDPTNLANCRNPFSSSLNLYYQRVLEAEEAIFSTAPSPPRVEKIQLPKGSLGGLSKDQLTWVLSSDFIVVFGSSIIRGALLDEIVKRGAVNLHIGISPYYRGSACNFWALHDDRPDLVGATIHRLSGSIDGGSILFHDRPNCEIQDPFEFTMFAVRSSQEYLARLIGDGEFGSVIAFEQDRKLQLRHSRRRDFTGEEARLFLESAPSRIASWKKILRNSKVELIEPHFSTF